MRYEIENVKVEAAFRKSQGKLLRTVTQLKPVGGSEPAMRSTEERAFKQKSRCRACGSSLAHLGAVRRPSDWQSEQGREWHWVSQVAGPGHAEPSTSH